ncbi:MAG: crossover junction endodeoxyribonuclease RuvC [Nitrospirota bacterium]
MRILGIDPGIGTTGFAIIEKNISGHERLSLLQSGEIRATEQMKKSKSSDDFRLKIIFMELQEMIGGVSLDAVAIEDTFFAKNVKSALTLGQARGVAILAAQMHNLPIFEYSPKSVKLAVVGYGSATKEQVQFMVGKILNLSAPIDSEHMADAAAVAICHAYSERWHAASVATATPKLTTARRGTP